MAKTVGFIILAISCLSFLLILVIPWLGFSKGKVAGIITGLIIVGEVLFYLSLFILGRSYYDKIKSKLSFWRSKRKDNDLAQNSGTV
jgi:hypothetical protein